MTYEEFYESADEHINEIVRFEVLFVATGKTVTMERVNTMEKRDGSRKKTPQA